MGREGERSNGETEEKENTSRAGERKGEKKQAKEKEQ